MHVLAYFGRYTHRVGIANSRLLDVEPEHVTFRTKGMQTETLHPVAFLRRFIQHVLPDGFHEIRHTGLYASAQSSGLLEKTKATLPSHLTQSRTAWSETPATCPHCGSPMIRLPLDSFPRAPPEEAA
jgi:hypothetical protein